MAKTLFSPFYTSSDSMEHWEFSGPNGVGLQNKGGKWNWSKNKTKTSKTGPSSGQSHGYVFIESSSPTTAGSEFTMTTIDTFNAKESEIYVSYYYNSNTDTPCTLEVFGWDGFKWRLEDKYTPDETELVDKWVQRSFRIEDYTNTDCKIRFKVTTGLDGKSYRKDFALDSINIISSDSDIDEFVTFFETKNIFKKKKFGKVFNGLGKSNISNILDDFKTELKKFDFKKYNGSIVLLEDEHTVHVFTEADKGE